MPTARRCLVALAFVIAACASSSSGGVSVAVAELRGRGQRPQAVGAHYFRIRVTNRGTEPILVESIHIQPAGMTELDVEDATENFDESIASGDTRTFDMEIRVMSSRASSAGMSIDSLRVMVVGRNEKGRFTDSGDYGVGTELIEP
jgi:hypothetical protein